MIPTIEIITNNIKAKYQVSEETAFKITQEILKELHKEIKQFDTSPNQKERKGYWGVVSLKSIQESIEPIKHKTIISLNDQATNP